MFNFDKFMHGFKDFCSTCLISFKPVSGHFKRVIISIVVILLSVTSCSTIEYDISDTKSYYTPQDTIFFNETTVYQPDEDAICYRIPAITALQNGNIVVINDKRKNSYDDLPNDIDILSRVSCDNGKTWSEPQFIAEALNSDYGYGDAAVVQTLTGELVSAFVGGNSIEESTPEYPLSSYISRSKDGINWQKPIDVTSLLWGEKALRDECKHYVSSFFGSGSGLLIQKGKYSGRIMFVAALYDKTSSSFDNYIFYSDDNGYTWKVSGKAFVAGDEAKVVELSDGRILLSVRNKDYRGYNISIDGGETWGEQGVWEDLNITKCNGDIISYPVMEKGNVTHLLFQTLPNSSVDRKDVTLFISYDDGKSWGDCVKLCDGLSGYSSMTILKDGSIGVYVEKYSDDYPDKLSFLNFSYKWIIQNKNSNR